MKMRKIIMIKTINNMEIQCVCINDKDRPDAIPLKKWVKKGQKYTVIFAIVVLPQRKLGLQLEEIDLDETCAPYEYFLAHRFAFAKEDFDKLPGFIEQCGQTNLSIQEIMHETNVERTADTVEAN